MLEERPEAPQEIRLDTRALPPDMPLRRRIDASMEIFDAACPIDMSLTKDQPYWAKIRARAAGGIFSVDVEASGAAVRRTEPIIARRSTGCLYVFQQINQQGCTFTTWNDRRGGRLRHGDLYVGSADEPFDATQGEVFGHRLWMLPSHLVLPFAHNPGGLHAGTWLRANDPFTAMLASYLNQFTQHAPRMASEIAEAFAINMGRILALASAPSDDPLRTSTTERAARGARIRQEIETRLADPLLSPTRLADTLGIPLRTLHAAFAGSGDSCLAYITARRLDEARRLLLRANARSVSDIAFGIGFNSMATFFRTYRKRFGETPTETRVRGREGRDLSRSH
jgi:AraC-like DNA-binding protein